MITIIAGVAFIKLLQLIAFYVQLMIACGLVPVFGDSNSVLFVIDFNRLQVRIT